jgi:hypothetical protein
MVKDTRIVSIAVLLAVSALPSQSYAHFKLLQPTSWLKEDTSGGPQKGKPCGPGGYDDVQPSPLSDAVTTVHAGDTIQVELQETINHPGYFRVALSADRASFTDPPLTNATSCSLDLASVPTGAHDNVLMDGIAKSASAAANRHIMQDVKLPDQPCDNCTLQVLQVMKDHGPPNCFYYHCAVLQILPADAAAAGSVGAAAGAGGVPAGGTGAAGSAGRAGGTAGSATAAGSGGPVAGAAGSGGPVAGAAGSGAQAGAGTAAGSSSVAGSPGTAGSSSGAAGSSTTGPPAGSTTPTTSSKSSGCSVARLGLRESASLPTALWTIAACVLLRRKRHQGRKA